MKNNDSIWRTIVKTIFFKIGTTSITAYFTGWGGAIKIHLILTLFYILYERVWSRIHWGTNGWVLAKKEKVNAEVKTYPVAGPARKRAVTI